MRVGGSKRKMSSDEPLRLAQRPGQARLSEFLRLAVAKGSQRIGIWKAVVVPARLWSEMKERRKPLGRRLIAEYATRG